MYEIIIISKQKYVKQKKENEKEKVHQMDFCTGLIQEFNMQERSFFKINLC